MEDLDPDLFPKGDLPAPKKKGSRGRPRLYSEEEAKERQRIARCEYMRRQRVENIAKGLTAQGKIRVRVRGPKNAKTKGLGRPRFSDSTDALYTRILYAGEKRPRDPQYAKKVTEEQYRSLRNKDNHQLSRLQVSPISDFEAHEKMALNSLVKQEGGYLLRHGFMNCSEGGWMKKRSKF